MRRFFWGLALASLTVSAPVTAFGGDREIANQIISSIKKQQAHGSLKGFDIDLKVEAGVVTLTGSVANPEQATSVLVAAYETADVREVIDRMQVRSQTRSSQHGTQMATAAFDAENDFSVRQASNDDAGEPLYIQSETKAPSEWTPAPAEPLRAETPKPIPSSADSTITNAALSKLAQVKSSGALRHFELDVSTVNAEVWVRGFVANAQQKQLVLKTVQHVPGVRKVIDDITIGRGPVQPASGNHVVASPQHGSMPVVGSRNSVPRPFAPSSVASYDGEIISGGPVSEMSMGAAESMMPTPVPMNMGPSYGAGVPRYDQPQMPGYAWPSYAAYPNYAAVTYPKQYSASAWPYIGPFYPYPQVPLGWRKVALEWDDGLWYLDFTSK